MESKWPESEHTWKLRHWFLTCGSLSVIVNHEMISSYFADKRMIRKGITYNNAEFIILYVFIDHLWKNTRKNDAWASRMIFRILRWSPLLILCTVIPSTVFVIIPYYYTKLYGILNPFLNSQLRTVQFFFNRTTIQAILWIDILSRKLILFCFFHLIISRLWKQNRTFV